MAESVTIYADADTYISSATPTSNFGTALTLVIGDPYDSVNANRTLIHFPFTAIPHGSTILSATMYVRMYSEATNNARTVGVYRVLTNWGETTATWNSPWVTAGLGASDYDSANPVGSFPVDVNGEPALKTISLTLATVQGMFDGDYANYGFLLRTSVAEDADVCYYASRTYTAFTSYRPSLYITYIAGGHYWIIG